MRVSGDVSFVFFALGAALAAFGLLNGAAVAAGAWFGPISPAMRLRNRRCGAD